jgi:hypothetical protein
LCRGIGGGELGCKVGEVSECKLTRVGAVAYGEEAYIIFDDVTYGNSEKPVIASHRGGLLQVVLSRFNASFWCRITTHASEYYFGL